MEQLDVVVLGGGNAAGYFCRAAVQHGFAAGRVTVIGAEEVCDVLRVASLLRALVFVCSS
jgi:predicted flavoprotein YhiN